MTPDATIRICVTGAEASPDALAARLARPADQHEVRLDLLDRIDDDALEVVRGHGARIVVALRPVREGGRFAGDEGVRLALLRRAVEAGAAEVDLELDVFERGDAARVLCPDDPAAWDACVAAWRAGVRDVRCLDGLPGPGAGRARPRIVLSCHATGGGAGVLASLAARAARFPADTIKLAVPVEGAEDLDALAAEGREAALAGGPRRVVIGLGTAGVATRARPRAFGSDGTYAAAGAGLATAPGQATLEDLLAWRVRDADGLEPILLVGGPQVCGSPGPDVYNRLFAAVGAPWQYLAAPAARWEDCVALAGRLGARRLSVTMPLKRAAARAAGDAGDAQVRSAGAANSVRIEGGRIVAAANTDAAAARSILASTARGEAGTVLLLGAGGAAAAFGAAARDLGWNVVAAVRDASRVRETGDGLADARIVSWDDRHRVAHDVLVNGTPMGADGAASPWDADTPLAASTVVDLVNARGGPTPLVRAARAAGCATVGGPRFWAMQGAAQIRWMTGIALDVDVLEAEAVRALGTPRESRPAPRVIALIGMRGAGKTTVGQALASRLGWRLLDTDVEVERRLGVPIAGLFRDGREAVFRRVEALVTDEALRTDRTVVATGGGCVEDAGTRAALRQGFAAWLDLPADVLAARVRGSGRPSLTGAAPEAEVADVLERRRPLYAGAARVVAGAGGAGPAEVCDAIEHAWRALPDHDVR